MMNGLLDRTILDDWLVDIHLQQVFSSAGFPTFVQYLT